MSKHYFGRGQDLVAPLRLVLIADRSMRRQRQRGLTCTNPCSCPTVPTMSSTTERDPVERVDDLSDEVASSRALAPG